MKITITSLLCLVNFMAFAQSNVYPVNGDPIIYGYSPRLTLQRSTDIGGYAQGIQTLLYDGTPNWFFGNLHDQNWIVAKGDFQNPKFIIKDNGNVGIGTTSPSRSLEIYKDGGSAKANTYLRIASGASGAYGGNSHIESTYNDYGNIGVDMKTARITMAADVLTPTDVGGAISFFTKSLGGTINDEPTEQMKISSNGNVGIGTAVPSEKLSVFGAVNAKPDVVALESSRNDASYVEVGALKGKNSGTDVAKIGMLRGSGTYTGFLNFSVKAGNDSPLFEAVRITENGNLGVGTTAPTEKLSVNGKIRAHEIKVETANWPDYVFEDNYKIASLTELEKYIKENKHLPEMPTVKQVAENGIELGEMNKLLLKKVEELTLHLINKDKELQNSNKRLLNVETKQKELEMILGKLNLK